MFEIPKILNSSKSAQTTALLLGFPRSAYPRKRYSNVHISGCMVVTSAFNNVREAVPGFIECNIATWTAPISCAGTHSAG
jgi:hypothetical protein